MDYVKEVVETDVDLNTALELLKAYGVEYQDWQSFYNPNMIIFYRDDGMPTARYTFKTGTIERKIYYDGKEP